MKRWQDEIHHRPRRGPRKGPGKDPRKDEDREAGDSADLVVRQLQGDLSQPGSPRDFTGDVMGRLGYMRLGDRATQRRRLRRWTSRLTLCVLLFGAAGIALKVHQDSWRARQPAGTTVPEAIGVEFRQHQDRLEGTIRTIRNLSPDLPVQVSPDAAQPPEPPTGPELIDEDIDRSAVGPVAWL